MTDDTQCSWICPDCGRGCCRGCLTQADLDKLNYDILMRAQAKLVSPIVSEPYVVEKKK